MIKTLEAKDVDVGMQVMLGAVTYKVTHKEESAASSITFNLLLLGNKAKIRTKLVSSFKDELTVRV